MLLPEQDRESCATFLPIIKGAGSNPTCYHSSIDSSSHAADDVKGIHHELSAEGARYGHGDTNDKETDHRSSCMMHVISTTYQVVI